MDEGFIAAKKRLLMADEGFIAMKRRTPVADDGGTATKRRPSVVDEGTPVGDERLMVRREPGATTALAERAPSGRDRQAAALPRFPPLHAPRE